MIKKEITATTEKKGSVKQELKSGVSVLQLASDTGISVERLLLQFKDAHIKITKTNDIVSEEEKQKLLRYLQQHHGAKSDIAPEKIFLRT